MALTLWHNPRCSKSRQALQLLEEAGAKPKLRLYLKEPPNEDEMMLLLAALSKPASEIVRRGEAIFKENSLKHASEDALLAAMIKHPILIERPIAVLGDKAVVGRPPEDVLKLL